jgi:hypothetical protein
MKRSSQEFTRLVHQLQQLIHFFLKLSLPTVPVVAVRRSAQALWLTGDLRLCNSVSYENRNTHPPLAQF